MRLPRKGSGRSAAACSCLVLALLAFPLPSLAREAELWGSLLCHTEGDSLRADPLDRQNLVVQVSVAPEAVALTSQAGFFRIRLKEVPGSIQTLLTVFCGPEEVASLSIYLERGRWDQIDERWIYNLGSLDLRRSCESLAVDLPTARAAMIDLQRSAVEASTTQDRVPWYMRPVAALAPVLAGAAFLASSSNDAPPGDCDSLVIEDVDIVALEDQALNPGEYPTYAHQSTSASLGRSLTSRRAPEELALWNPSALVFSPWGGIAVSVATPRQIRGSLRVPVRLGPLRSLNLGTTLLRTDRPVRLTLDDATGLETTLDHNESVVVAGVGLKVLSKLAASVGYRYYAQDLQQVHRGRRKTCEDGGSGAAQIEPIVVSQDRTRSDIDLSLTWDAIPRFRMGGTIHHLFGAESLGPDGEQRALREGMLGGLFSYRRAEVGVEILVHDRQGHVAGGLSFRAADFLALDIAAGSRYEALQAGVDVFVGPAVVKGRLGRDEFDSLRGTVVVDLRSW